MEYKEAFNKLLERNRELEVREESRKNFHYAMTAFLNDVLIVLIFQVLVSFTAIYNRLAATDLNRLIMGDSSSFLFDGILEVIKKSQDFDDSGPALQESIQKFTLLFEQSFEMFVSQLKSFPSDTDEACKVLQKALDMVHLQIVQLSSNVSYD